MSNKRSKGSKKVTPVEHKDFDLGGYINQYHGHTKIIRLVWLAQRNPAFQTQAFNQALELILSGSNATLYNDVVTRIFSVCDPAVVEAQGWKLDQDWISRVTRISQDNQNRLQAQYDLVKRDEDIRQPIMEALEAVGDFNAEIGDYHTAISKYDDAHIQSTNSTDALRLFVKQMKAGIAHGSFISVSNNMVRCKRTRDWQSKGNLTNDIYAIGGLHSLKDSSYNSAANSFTRISKDFKSGEVISSRDAVVYGTLTVLASWNRRDMKTLVSQQSDFKEMLDSEPEYKAMLHEYLNGEYASFFGRLNAVKPDLECDYYLARHFNTLYRKILNRALILYFRPYSTVNITEMAVAFGLDVDMCERLLADLIADNRIQARIDSANKVMYSRSADVRIETFDRALDMGTRYIRDAKALLLRMSLVKHDFCVSPPERKRKETEGKGG